MRETRNKNSQIYLVLTFLFGVSRIEDIKRMVKVKTGTEIEYQRLMFAGKQLEDGFTMGYYKITERSTLHLVVR